MLTRTLAVIVALYGSRAHRRRPRSSGGISMTGANNTGVNELASRFNASQKEYKVVPVFKGSYPESMTAAIAAFRAGNPPHILQVFEVGTATMMAAKGAIVPVAKVMADAKEPFDPKDYLPTVTGYYSDSKGNMLSYPFNSSTVVFYCQQGRIQEGGPRSAKRRRSTWKEFVAAAEKLKASGQECVYTHRLAGVDAHRELQRLAQRADRHQAERHGRHRHRVHASTRRCTCGTSRCSATWRRRACSPTAGGATRPRRASRAANARW